MPVDIILTVAEFESAAQTGFARYFRSLAKGSKDARNLKTSHEDGAVKHWRGACFERVVSKLLNCYCRDSVGTYKSEPDLVLPNGSPLEVKGSHHGRYLIVQPTEDEDQWFVFCSGEFPKFTVWGAIRGEEAKQECYRRNLVNRGEAFFVPVKDLEDISCLKQSIA